MGRIKGPRFREDRAPQFRRAAKIVRRRLLAVDLFAITTSAIRPSTPETESFAFNKRGAGVGELGGGTQRARFCEDSAM